MNQLVFTPFPILKTQRLELRELQKDDIGNLFKLRTSKETNEFIKREIPETISDLFPFIERIRKGVINNEYLYWAISKNNFLIGIVCLWNFSEDNLTAEIGYELHPDFQKKGYMNEALASIISYSFSKLQLNSIEAFTHKNNKASIALLEKNNFVKQHTIIENSKDNVSFKLKNNK